MTDQKCLSDPITLRLPKDVLERIEEIAVASGQTPSWVIVRALRTYIAGEGEEVLSLTKAQQEIDRGEWHDLDDVLDEMDMIVRGDAA